jgi:hypothetical protein
MTNRTRWWLVLCLTGAFSCGTPATSSNERAVSSGSGSGSGSDAAVSSADAGGGSGSADASIILADAGSGSGDASVILADAGGGSGSGDASVGFPDAGGGSDAGSGSDAGPPDDPGESDGIDPIVEPIEIGAPDPVYDNCDDLAARDAAGISTPNDNQRGRSYQCFGRYIARVGGPVPDSQDPAYSPVDSFDGVIGYPTREDQDTAAYEAALADEAGTADNVIDILKGLDLDGLAADKYDCEPAKAGHVPNPKSGDLWQYMYIPGIQAFDDVPFLDNGGTANRYVQMAEWGADSANNINTFSFPVSEISRWRLFHYHNEPSVTAGKPGVPVSKVFKKRKWIGPPGDVVGSVENYALATHRTKIEDDKNEVRNLAAWASAATQADFIAKPPKPGATTVLAAGPVKPGGPQITAADFTAWYNGRIAEKPKGGFQWFFRNAAWIAAHSYYCRKPIFAHSGGGPVKLAMLRLLDAYSESLAGKPLRKIRDRNAVIWRAYGLEEVISKEIRTLVEGLPSYKDKLVIYNYVESTGGQKGGNTWRDLIKVEIENVGQTPLVKEYQNMNIKVKPSVMGHAWIGWTPLYTGAFYNPKTLFPSY